MDSLGPATRRGLADEVTDRIRAAILSGEISPGEKVGEAELSRMLTVSRTVVQVDPKFHPAGQRFLVKMYPKDKEYRRLKLSQQLTVKLTARIKDESLRDDDLLFTMPRPDSPAARLRALPDPATLGFTTPNAADRQYRHGTMSGYNAGKCRCRHCTDAAAIYRASRRANGKDEPRQRRMVDTDGHISRDWFRQSIWSPALLKAGMTLHVRAHDLRHAHASWLLHGGADLQVVKERLGHGSISTTEKYLHKVSGIASDGRETAGRLAVGGCDSRMMTGRGCRLPA